MNYQIKQGDTYCKIAREQCGAKNDKEAMQIAKNLARVNNNSNPDLIYAGDTIKLVNLNGEELSTGDGFERSGDVTQDYLKWNSDEGNIEKALAGKHSEIPEFEAFHFDRKELEGKSVAEQAKIYKDKMEPLAQGIIASVDTEDENGKKDGALNFEEYIKLASDGKYKLEDLENASKIMAEYDKVDEKGKKAPDGKIQREELKKYVADKYGKDIDKISSEEFDKYAQEAAKIMEFSNIDNLFKTNFTNLAKMDENAETISKEEFTTFLTTHDIDWNELGKNPDKKVLDVVDGKLNFSVGQSFASDPSEADYENQVEYTNNLFNALYGQQ